RLAMAICSIQAIKGVTIGDAFSLAGVPGSAAHDEIFYAPERGYYRESNRAGGLEGGMTTGCPLVVRAAMKPLPTLTKPLRSVDTETHEPAQALRERTDSCTVPAAAVVGEAMVAFVIADAYRGKFGGDHIDDVRGALAAYEEELVCGLLAGAKGGSVISLGGGSVLSARVREALEPHLVVLVDVEPEVAWERVGHSANGSRRAQGSRPLARDREAFFALHAER